MPALEDNQDKWEVEVVKDRSICKGEVYYLVKWAGWPLEYNQWLPEENMSYARGVIADYEKKLKV